MVSSDDVSGEEFRVTEQWTGNMARDTSPHDSLHILHNMYEYMFRSPTPGHSATITSSFNHPVDLQ